MLIVPRELETRVEEDFYASYELRRGALTAKLVPSA